MSEDLRFREYPTLAEIVHLRTAARFVEAIERARIVLRHVRKAGVDLRVFGSLVRGMESETRFFHEGSDVDFVVFSHLDVAERDGLERAVENLMGPLPVDIVYLEEIASEHVRQRVEASAVAELPALTSLAARPGPTEDAIWIELAGEFDGMRRQCLRARARRASLDQAPDPAGERRRQELVDAMTYNLTSVCTHVERVLKKLARHVDRDLPARQERYGKLLARLGRDVPGRRPAVLSEQTVTRLDALRRFRDRSRSAPFAIPADLVREQVRALAPTLEGFYQDIRTFAIGPGGVEAERLLKSLLGGEDNAADDGP